MRILTSNYVDDFLFVLDDSKSCTIIHIYQYKDEMILLRLERNNKDSRKEPQTGIVKVTL